MCLEQCRACWEVWREPRSLLHLAENFPGPHELSSFDQALDEGGVKVRGQSQARLQCSAENLRSLLDVLHAYASIKQNAIGNCGRLAPSLHHFTPELQALGQMSSCHVAPYERVIGSLTQRLARSITHQSFRTISSACCSTDGQASTRHDLIHLHSTHAFELHQATWILAMDVVSDHVDKVMLGWDTLSPQAVVHVWASLENVRLDGAIQQNAPQGRSAITNMQSHSIIRKKSLSEASP
mmetsp:Transcript_49899/g.92122  ORF Transcript_49899/g.92122 Transcript_49899/m.92122 type:complete len:239 (-) Transcript_49899:737-1453(-)